MGKGTSNQKRATRRDLLPNQHNRANFTKYFLLSASCEFFPTLKSQPLSFSLVQDGIKASITWLPFGYHIFVGSPYIYVIKFVPFCLSILRHFNYQTNHRAKKSRRNIPPLHKQILKPANELTYHLLSCEIIFRK